jgi:sigma-E factor negative regulatory protein RseA
MSEQIREQISAFLDGELPSSETELLLKRLTRDAELREGFGRYALVGECVRGGGHARLTQGFAARVNRAIDGDSVADDPQPQPRRATGWWRPLAGAAVAASVAAVAVVALQQRAVSPPGVPAVQIMASGGLPAIQSGAGPSPTPTIQFAAAGRQVSPGQVTEPGSYVVPPSSSEGPTPLPAARLTNYVFAHSKYSSVMGQNDVLNDLLSEADADAAGDASQDRRAAP